MQPCALVFVSLIAVAESSSTAGKLQTFYLDTSFPLIHLLLAEYNDR